ncbi:hypothetical protein D3C71_813550 [compost metagenome]
MRDTDRRVGLVDVLATGAGGAIGIDAQVGRVDLDGFLFVRLGQYRHGAGRGVDAALGLGRRNPLHTVRAGFEFELAVDVVALDPGNHLFIAAVFTLVLRKDLHPPATTLGVTRIHAEQVAGENRRFVTTGTGTDLEEHVAAVVRVLGQQHALQVGFERDQAFLGLADFFHGHFTHVRVAVLEQCLGAFEVVLHFQQFFIGAHDRFNFRVLLGIGAELVLIGNDLAIAQQGGQFLETVLEDIQLIEQ